MSAPNQPKRWDERVRVRAYFLWESEGRPLGRNDEFWDRAHKEIIAEAQAEAAAGGESPSGSEPTES